MALAYFLTFSTYGTWLPGNAKGSVDRDHNGYDAPLLPPGKELEQRARETLRQSPYVLGAAEREIVCAAIVTLAAERGWHLLAAHIRSNHVHVVIQADRDPGRVMSDLKARASRELTHAGCDTADRLRWTRHGSTKHLFFDHEIAEKIDYTLNGQGERMAWYAVHESRTQ